jgi:hypothetical protein
MNNTKKSDKTSRQDAAENEPVLLNAPEAAITSSEVM